MLLLLFHPREAEGLTEARRTNKELDRGISTLGLPSPALINELTKSSADTLWLKVFRDHPGVLTLFAVGQESVLSSVRTHNVHLDRMMRIVGPPNPGVLKVAATRHESGGSTVPVASSGSGMRYLYAGEELLPAEAKQVAEAICSSEACQRFVNDGFIHFPGVVSEPLVAAARRIINRALGDMAVGKDPDAMKNMGNTDNGEILDLFRRSPLCLVAEELIGPFHPANSAQVALRYPGDFCKQGTFDVPTVHCDAHFMNWHIDGCAVPEPPQNHYGKIRNFTALIGVLLSDVPRPLSGELSCYPGSHMALGNYLRTTAGALEAVQCKGVAGLPSGSMTKTLFPLGHRSCLGRAGDVFIANYMMAHTIAPNTSGDIRYAVYFRVYSSAFSMPCWENCRLEAMVDPWLDWKGRAIASIVPHLPAPTVPLPRAKGTVVEGAAAASTAVVLPPMCCGAIPPLSPSGEGGMVAEDRQFDEDMARAVVGSNIAGNSK